MNAFDALSIIVSDTSKAARPIDEKFGNRAIVFSKSDINKTKAGREIKLRMIGKHCGWKTYYGGGVFVGLEYFLPSVEWEVLSKSELLTEKEQG